MPADESGRDEHRAQHERDGHDGPADFVHGLARRLVRLQPVLDVVLDGFHHHDGVVDHDADGQHQAEQRKVVERETRTTAITANVPISDTGTASIGMSVARQVCRNTSTTMTTSSDRLNKACG